MTGVASRVIESRERNEFIRGPKWRTRTSPKQRARAATVTFGTVVATGAVVLGGLMWLMAWIGAPTWLVLVPWLLPTVGGGVWALFAPRPAVATDDDDDSWVVYAIQYVVIGENEARPAPVRAAAAVLFGAPLAWSLLVFGLSTLVGLF